MLSEHEIQAFFRTIGFRGFTLNRPIESMNDEDFNLLKEKKGEINSNFRSWSVKNHPDKGGDAAVFQMTNNQKLRLFAQFEAETNKRWTDGIVNMKRALKEKEELEKHLAVASLQAHCRRKFLCASLHKRSALTFAVADFMCALSDSDSVQLEAAWASLQESCSEMSKSEILVFQPMMSVLSESLEELLQQVSNMCHFEGASKRAQKPLSLFWNPSCRVKTIHRCFHDVRKSLARHFGQLRDTRIKAAAAEDKVRVQTEELGKCRETLLATEKHWKSDGSQLRKQFTDFKNSCTSRLHEFQTALEDMEKQMNHQVETWTRFLYTCQEELKRVNRCRENAEQECAKKILLLELTEQELVRALEANRGKLKVAFDGIKHSNDKYENFTAPFSQLSNEIQEIARLMQTIIKDCGDGIPCGVDTDSNASARSVKAKLSSDLDSDGKQHKGQKRKFDHSTVLSRSHAILPEEETSALHDSIPSKMKTSSVLHTSDDIELILIVVSAIYLNSKGDAGTTEAKIAKHLLERNQNCTGEQIKGILEAHSNIFAKKTRDSIHWRFVGYQSLEVWTPMKVQAHSVRQGICGDKS